MSDEELELEDLNDLLDPSTEGNTEENTLDTAIEPINEDFTKKGTKKKMSEFQKNVEYLYSEFEKAKKESNEKKLQAKGLKDEIIFMLEEKGVDEIVINGLDSIVKLSITYPEREVLDKKSLASALNIKMKELTRPEVIISLTKDGKITTDMIEQFTVTEEIMTFNAEEYRPDENK